jgi:hypothetical protein
MVYDGNIVGSREVVLLCIGLYPHWLRGSSFRWANPVRQRSGSLYATVLVSYRVSLDDSGTGPPPQSPQMRWLRFLPSLAMLNPAGDASRELRRVPIGSAIHPNHAEQ